MKLLVNLCVKINNMKQIGFKAKVKKGNVTINVSVPLLSFKEDDAFIVYSPALDISGYGDTEEEARKSFELTLEEFISYTLNKNTFQLELTRLGWKIKKRNILNRYTPPPLDELIIQKDYLSSIIREKDFHSYRETIQLPA